MLNQPKSLLDAKNKIFVKFKKSETKILVDSTNVFLIEYSVGREREREKERNSRKTEIISI